MKTLNHDVALPADVTQPASRTASWLSKLPALLRILGTAALVIAMYSFLIKGWQSGDDTLRYLMMLGHTALLAGLGFFSGHWLKESKSARLLITLALVAVPVNFAILGAFIYSQFGNVAAINYPYLAFWQAENSQQPLMLSALTVAVLAPVVFFGFRVLLRHMAMTLSLFFLISNSLLLIPWREPMLIGAIILLLTAITLWFNRRASNRHIAAKTHEGIIALSLQLLPLTVLAGRSLWLYSVDFLLIATLCLALFVVVRQIAILLTPASRASAYLNALCLVFAAAEGIALGASLMLSGFVSLAFIVPLSLAATALMVYDIAQRSATHAALYRRLAAGIIVAGNLINLWFFATGLASLACFVSGLILGYRGLVTQQRSLFAGGVGLSTLSIGYQTYLLISEFDFNSWFALAGIGIAAILIASVIESQSSRVKTFWRGWCARFGTWES